MLSCLLVLAQSSGLQYLVFATIRERPSLKEGIKQQLVADRYNLNKLVDRETRKEYQIDVANRFSALEGLEISSVDDTWVNIRDNQNGGK